MRPCLLQHAAQFFQHLLIGEFLAARQNDFPRLEEQFRLDDAFKNAVGSNPFVRRIVHMLLFQFARGPVIDVVADVFFVGENLMHRRPVPCPPKVRDDALCVQNLRRFRIPIFPRR